MAPSRALAYNAPVSALASGLPAAAAASIRPAINSSCFRNHRAAPFGRICFASPDQQMAERSVIDVEESSRDFLPGLALMLVAEASGILRGCSVALGFLRSSHQQLAELQRKNVDEAALPDSFSQLAKIIVAGACATAALGFPTLHSGAAYAAEGVAEESSTAFQRSCAGCHAGGGNVLQPNATLFAKDLDRNGIPNSDGIFQITYFGKGRMPGYGEKCTPRGQCTFGPRLSDSDIRALAEFVRVQAGQGWTAK